MSSEDAPSPLRRLRSLAGRVRRRVRRWVDDGLHPGRRERARKRLGEGPPVREPLFLCLGNVCRSPYAEARYRSLLGLAAPGAAPDSPPPRDGPVSAGFIGPGRPPPERAREVARRRGVETGGHTSRVVTRAMVDGSDLVVLVEPSHARRLRRTVGAHDTPVLILGDLDPDPIRSRRIRDPWGREAEEFERVFARIDRCLEELVRITHPSPAGRQES